MTKTYQKPSQNPNAPTTNSPGVNLLANLNNNMKQRTEDTIQTSSSKAPTNQTQGEDIETTPLINDGNNVRNEDKSTLYNKRKADLVLLIIGSAAFLTCSVVAICMGFAFISAILLAATVACLTVGYIVAKDIDNGNPLFQENLIKQRSSTEISTNQPAKA